VWVVQVIHMVNNTLPKLCCHTCKNKFHSGEHLRAYAHACTKSGTNKCPVLARH